MHADRVWSHVYIDGGPELRRPAGAARAAARRGWQRNSSLALPAVVRETRSADGFTRKFLLALADGRRIEMVLMRFTGRMTACISSQVGCAMGCVFCATGQMGFSRQLDGRRNRRPGHAPARVLRASASGAPARVPGGQRLRNVVLMGMGEPLHNYDAVMRAAWTSCAIRTARPSARGRSP